MEWRSKEELWFTFISPGRRETGGRAAAPWRCVPACAHSERGQHSAADPSTAVWDVQTGPLHGAGVEGCDTKGAREKTINARNESVRAVYFVQAAEDDLWNLQGTGTLVLHLHQPWRHFNRLLTSASSEVLSPR